MDLLHSFLPLSAGLISVYPIFPVRVHNLNFRRGSNVTLSGRLYVATVLMEAPSIFILELPPKLPLYRVCF